MIRKRLSATLTALVFLGGLGVSAVSAEEGVTPEIAGAVTDGAPDRFSLVRVDNDVLRVDRQNGTVSVCQQKNDAWRCNPVPLAEEAYLAEINALSDKVEQLTTRLEAAENTRAGEPALPPGAALDRQKEVPAPEGTAPESAAPEGTSSDEEELDKVLDFTETAMRRFFGMVRELQKDLDTGGN